ncbi:MAG: AraC family transcriptional regulator [Eubacteriales bacterium]|nr:AraC family transcriptional regulator [Eubacteriales bacterium]
MDSFYEMIRDDMRHASAWTQEDDHYPMHFHSCVELSYVLSGELIVMQEQEEHVVSADSLFINSSYQLHGYRSPKPSLCRVAILPLATAPGIQARKGGLRFGACVYRGERRGELSRLMEMLQGASERSDEPVGDALATAIISMLISAVGLTEEEHAAKPALIKEVIRYIQNNLTGELNMSVLAAEFGYSVGRMSHLFNEQIGCSLTQYVNGFRCRLARELLSGEGMTVLDAAMQAGFANVRTFYRAFEREYGMTPAQYRSELR